MPIGHGRLHVWMLPSNAVVPCQGPPQVGFPPRLVLFALSASTTEYENTSDMPKVRPLYAYIRKLSLENDSVQIPLLASVGNTNACTLAPALHFTLRWLLAGRPRLPSCAASPMELSLPAPSRLRRSDKRARLGGGGLGLLAVIE